MSRLGKKPIEITSGTSVTFEDNTLNVKGPKGEISRKFKDDIKIVVDEKSVTLDPKKEDLFSKALWGTYASHIKNMIMGVNNEFEKKLMIEGIGFRAEVKGENLVLSVGFSHPVEIKIPAGLSVKTDKESITVTGIDKESVGQFCAKVRASKKPEPYKGKGIRYENEVVRRKQGKKSI